MGISKKKQTKNQPKKYDYSSFRRIVLLLRHRFNFSESIYDKYFTYPVFYLSCIHCINVSIEVFFESVVLLTFCCGFLRISLTFCYEVCDTLVMTNSKIFLMPFLLLVKVIKT